MCDHCRGQPAPYTGIHYISFLSDLSFARACIGRRMAYMGGGAWEWHQRDMGCCMAAVVGGDRDSCMGVPWDKHYGLRRNLSPRQGCPFGTHPLFLRARPLQWRQQALVRCSGGDNFKLDLYCNPPTTCPESLAHRPSDGWGINRVNTQVNRLLRRLPMFSAPSYILGNNVGAFPL